LQQPAGHVTASHEQTPVVMSQRPFAQEPHAAPPLPHCEDDCDEYCTHVLPLQQPFAHDVALQTHCPVPRLHSCPDAHAPQVAPPVPHDVFDSAAWASHVPPLQQPAGHEVTSQTHCPPLHSCPAPHALHVPPEVPHAMSDSLASGTQLPPLQQPAHDPPPQVHAPLEHASPLPHALHAAPAEPHWLTDWDA
jgi:hypothetical protein